MKRNKQKIFKRQTEPLNGSEDEIDWNEKLDHRPHLMRNCWTSQTIFYDLSFRVELIT